MKILTLNCGSSSIKFQVIETSLENIRTNTDKMIAKGLIEKIGLPSSIIKYEIPGKQPFKMAKAILDHIEALQTMVKILTEGETKIINQIEEIEAVGHRIVHGGETFAKSCIIDKEVEKKIEDCIEFAPLHNPHNLKGYRVSKKFFPNVPHAAVFDTGFHQTIPDYAYIYAIPHILYQKYKIRKYGFHGASHRYVSFRVAQLLGIKRADYKIITIHLGNGCSICAIDHGKSIDTSMGFTPVEGLVMGTRGGDMDTSVILHVMSREELTLQEADTLLNKHSGLYGVSGVSNDLREVLKAKDEGNDRARLAFDIFCYRLKKYIGSYMAAMGGADIIVFTGGIGENSKEVREQVCTNLDFMGISIDSNKNKELVGKEGEITADGALVRTFVIPTNEELVIARDTVRCFEGVI